MNNNDEREGYSENPDQILGYDNERPSGVVIWGGRALFVVIFMIGLLSIFF